MAPEHPAMRELFGVTRDDLDESASRAAVPATASHHRSGGEPEGLGRRQRGDQPANEGRILDAMKEAEKYPEFTKGMDNWYVMDPAFRRMVELLGPEQAIKDYQRFDTLTSMASPGSEVLTEINRGTAANMMAARGEFPLREVRRHGRRESRRRFPGGTARRDRASLSLDGTGRPDGRYWRAASWR